MNPDIKNAAHLMRTLSAGPLDFGAMARAAFPNYARVDAVRAATSGLNTLLTQHLIQGPDRDGRYSPTERSAAAMSAKIPRPLSVMRPIAEQLRDALAPHAIKLVIAGSVRRRKEQVGDIELVALVASQPDLFDAAPLPDSHLREALMVTAARTIRHGPKYTQVIIEAAPGDVTVDLFQTADPQRFGRLLFVRTGSADFVRRADAYFKSRTGGSIRDLLYYDHAGQVIPTPDEDDVFVNALGISPVAPDRRRPKPES